MRPRVDADSRVFALCIVWCCCSRSSEPTKSLELHLRDQKMHCKGNCVMPLCSVVDRVTRPTWAITFLIILLSHRSQNRLVLLVLHLPCAAITGDDVVEKIRSPKPQLAPPR